MRAEKPQQRWNAGGGRFALLSAYPVRIMLGLAASLAVLVLCFRLPVHDPLPGVGWNAAPEGQPITLKDLREAESGASPASKKRPGAPRSTFDATETATASGEGGSSAEGPGASSPGEKASDGNASDEQQEQTPLAKLPGTAQLHTLDRKPRAIGGIGGVYLKINYPEAARRDSIEGRLVLYFIVEEDGSTSHVQVAHSLHPLCDSAAVQAVRRTRFVPGRRDDEAVRVPMHLPVRFELIGSSSMQADRSSPNAALER